MALREEPPGWDPGRYGAGSDREGGPIGVPDDYEVPRTRVGPYSPRGGEVAANWGGEDRTPGTIGAARPLYEEGAEWGPASSGPAAILELQSVMAAAGLLEPGWRGGIWDERSRDAYKELLAEANGMGVTAEVALRMRAESQSFGGGGGGEGGAGGGGGGHWEYDAETGEATWVPDQYVPPPLQLRTTNRKDLERVFRAAVIDTMGEGWSRAQIAELAEAYNWQEIRVQKEAYDQQVAIERAEFEGTRAPGGGEVITEEAPISPETFIENEMIEQDPEGYQEGQIINEIIPNFLQMIDGWA